MSLRDGDTLIALAAGPPRWPKTAPDGKWNPWSGPDDPPGPSPPPGMFDKQVARRNEVRIYLLAHRAEATVEAYIAFHGPRQLGDAFAV